MLSATRPGAVARCSESSAVTLHVCTIPCAMLVGAAAQAPVRLYSCFL